jgi:hypothetical protein
MFTELPKITTLSEGSMDTISTDEIFIHRRIPTPASLPPEPTAAYCVLLYLRSLSLFQKIPIK